MKIKRVMPYFNIVTHHHAKMDFPQHRSFLDTLFKIWSQRIDVPLHQNGRRVPKKQKNRSVRHWTRHRHFIIPIYIHYLTYMLVPLLPYKMHRPNYGTYMVQLLPLDRIAGTKSRPFSGHILVRTRRLLTHHSPATLQPLHQHVNQ